jgi:hypothetical protein
MPEIKTDVSVKAIVAGVSVWLAINALGVFLLLGACYVRFGQLFPQKPDIFGCPLAQASFLPYQVMVFVILAVYLILLLFLPGFVTGSLASAEKRKNGFLTGLVIGIVYAAVMVRGFEEARSAFVPSLVIIAWFCLTSLTGACFSERVRGTNRKL